MSTDSPMLASLILEQIRIRVLHCISTMMHRVKNVVQWHGLIKETNHKPIYCNAQIVMELKVNSSSFVSKESF